MFVDLLSKGQRVRVITTASGGEGSAYWAEGEIIGTTETGLYLMEDMAPNAYHDRTHRRVRGAFFPWGCVAAVVSKDEREELIP